MTTVGLVYSRLRQEERLLLDAAERLGVAVAPQNDAELQLRLDGGLEGDVILSRSVSTSRGLAVLAACDAWGLPAVNRFDVAVRCADKAHTSWLLAAHGVPTPDTRVAFTADSALAALDDIGYPAVLKPVQGSWARMVSRLRDRAEADQLLEHREHLANPVQHIHYVQEYVDKEAGGSHADLRAFVVGDETIACIRRRSPHWITNTARGAVATGVAVTPELGELCVRAAEAVGGGVLAIDLMESRDGLIVHEVNHTMEFRNSIAPTGVDIPARILAHCVSEAKR
jgi:[lysine-biosynthesis-protein LysW]--L-2-aminoadipate ligase